MNKETIERFLLAFAADPAIQAFAGKHTIAVQYYLTDLNVNFYTAFRDGQVQAGEGAPDPAADLVLRMPAETFDGVFSGKVNAESAAMSGKIQFTGDVYRAMALQGIQRDMFRIYTAAKEDARDA